MKPATSITQLFASVLKLGSLLMVGIAVLGSVIGYLVGGTNALLSALTAGVIAVIFVSLTSVSVWIGAKLPLAGFYGAVMGAWLFKVVLFLGAVALLHRQPWVNGPVLFFTLVASILASLVLDAMLFAKARLPIGE